MLKGKVTSLVQSVTNNKVKIAVMSVGAIASTSISAFADTTMPTVDLSGPFTSAIGNTVTQTVGLFGAVVPYALLIFGAKFAWVKSVAFFASMSTK